MANAMMKPDNGAAGATDYLHLIGLVALGHMWGRIAAAILAKLNPRAAGIILNEIDAPRAARIAAEMAGVGARRDTARSAP